MIAGGPTCPAEDNPCLAFSEELFCECRALDLEVLSHHVEEGGERPDAERVVHRNRDVVLAEFLRRESHVAAGLPRNLVAKPLEPPGELAAREVTRQLHAAMISSCT